MQIERDVIFQSDPSGCSESSATRLVDFSALQNSSRIDAKNKTVETIIERHPYSDTVLSLSSAASANNLTGFPKANQFPNGPNSRPPSREFGPFGVAPPSGNSYVYLRLVRARTAANQIRRSNSDRPTVARNRPRRVKARL